MSGWRAIGTALLALLILGMFDNTRKLAITIALALALVVFLAGWKKQGLGGNQVPPNLA